MSRMLVWFSCGAASACAAKLASEMFPDCLIMHCDTLSTEHPDNARFLVDVESWCGKKIQSLKSDRYKDTWEVFEKRRYLSGPSGALCTTEMKKMPRREFQVPDDIHVFGFTADEEKRIKRFEEQNWEQCLWILRDHGITKQDCYRMVHAAGIELPAMYKLGYRNNNCIGCVKGKKGYWNKIRRDFPAVFERMAKQERVIGAACCGKGQFLDELPIDAGRYEEEDIECGPVCSSGEPE